MLKYSQGYIDKGMHYYEDRHRFDNRSAFIKVIGNLVDTSYRIELDGDLVQFRICN